MVKVENGDTICALATSARSGGVGIIRLSGARALSVGRTLAPDLHSVDPHRLHYTRFVDSDGKQIDDGYLAFMPGPRSYTAEDVVELHGHGGPVNLRRLLEAVTAAGARPAQRGEFTLRAFLNGRIDLSQAEAVLDVVQARTETALDIAHDQLRGGLGEAVRGALSALLDVLARLAVQIDFVDEDLGDVHHESFAPALSAVRARVQALSATFSQGRVLRDGARVVLVGPPNAGKSSLFNAILKQARAIVTDVPGTTRDFLEETADLGGVAVTLVDTAGLRETDDQVEAAGVERTVAVAQDADLILALTDCRTAPEPLPSELDAARVLAVRTKADLGDGDVSTVTSAGLAGLLETVRERVLPEGAVAVDHVVVTSARHHQALIAAGEAIEHAIAASESAQPPELVAVDVQEAVTQLGLVVGETTTDDLLDRIFSEFCIGK